MCLELPGEVMCLQTLSKHDVLVNCCACLGNQLQPGHDVQMEGDTEGRDQQRLIQREVDTEGPPPPPPPPHSEQTIFTYQAEMSTTKCTGIPLLNPAALIGDLALCTTYYV